MLRKRDIGKKILEKMLRMEYIGARHMAYEDISKGFPKHLAGEVRNVADDLIRINLILKKPTRYGLRISLNPHKMDEIERVVRNS